MFKPISIRPLDAGQAVIRLGKMAVKIDDREVGGVIVVQALRPGRIEEEVRVQKGGSRERLHGRYSSQVYVPGAYSQTQASSTVRPALVPTARIRFAPGCRVIFSQSSGS